MSRIAAIDVGTNSLVLAVADVALDAAGRPAWRRVSDVYAEPRLGQGVDAAGRLSAESITRVVSVLQDFRRAAFAARAERIVAAATSAVRDAANRDEFLHAVRQATGIDVRVISGDEEAALTFLASAAEFAARAVDGRIAVVDVGGGSTEFIAGPAGGPVAGAAGALDASQLVRRSLPIGGVRLTEKYVRGDPPSRAEYEALCGAIDAQLDTLPAELSTALRVAPLIGCSGTLTSLKAVELQLREFNVERVHATGLTVKEIERQIESYYLPWTIERKKSIAGLTPSRADLALTGAAICAAILRHFGRDAFIVSDRGLRYGLIAAAALGRWP